MKILMSIIIALLLFIVIQITIVAVVTMKVAGGNTSGQTVVPVTEEYTARRELLSWYNSLGSIRTRTNETNPATVIVDVVLGYEMDDKATAVEITQKSIEIKDYLRRYFTQKTADELRPQNEETLKIEIRDGINDTILTNTKIKGVRFMQLDIQR